MEIRCVTRNLGRRTRSHEWVEALYARPLDAPHVALLQELPAGRLSVPKHIEVLPESPEAVAGRQCRSAVLVDRNVLEVNSSGGYLHESLLGSYVAQVGLTSSEGGRLTVVSVHASPNPLTPEHREAVDVQRLKRRSEKHVWYADVVADELVRLLDRARPGHVLAAGDFNEAHAWDDTYRTDSSAEFFGRLADGGYVDATMAAWKKEHTTQVAQRYQVDRVFGSAGLDVHLASEPTDCLGRDDELSDHLPIRFALTAPAPPPAAGTPSPPSR